MSASPSDNLNELQHDVSLIVESIHACDAIGDGKRRAGQVARCASHALDNADVVALATAKILRALPRDCHERREALALISPAKQSLAQFTIIPQPAPLIEQPLEPIHTVLVDAELMRILVALGKGLQTLVYAVAQQMTRDGDGSGVIDEHALLATLTLWGVESTYKNMRKWFKGGDGVLWRWNKAKKRIYLYSPTRMTRWGRKGQLDAVKMALDAGRSELVSTNHPGVKLISVPVGATTKQWYGNLLAAWHNSRGEHTQGISRATLQVLWGVTKKTLITWEKATGIEVSKCYAQYTDFEHIPVKHAYPYLVETTLDGKRAVIVRAMARWSNVYNAPTMKERQHKRAPRERNRASKLMLEAVANGDIPNGDCGAAALNGGVGFKPTGRRSFYTNDGNLKNAFKRLHHHLKSDPTDDAPHFVRLGYAEDRRARWIYEQNSTGYQQTELDEMLPRRTADAWFAAHGGRGSYVAAWREMAAC